MVVPQKDQNKQDYKNAKSVLYLGGSKSLIDMLNKNILRLVESREVRQQIL